MTAEGVYMSSSDRFAATPFLDWRFSPVVSLTCSRGENVIRGGHDMRLLRRFFVGSIYRVTAHGKKKSRDLEFVARYKLDGREHYLFRTLRRASKYNTK